MEDVRRSLAVSIGSRGFAALVGLLALPVYLRALGVEAYGVVGLFASLQVLVAFMDLGLATTLTRALSGKAPGDDEALREGRDLSLTFEAAYLVLAAAMALLMAAAAPAISEGWVNLNRLEPAQVTQALQLAALSLACGWPVNLYAAGLAGLHRQLPLAVSTAGFACVRVLLSIAFLHHSATLQSFFAAQLLASVLHSLVARAQLWRALALPGHRARARKDLLKRSLGFAGGMTAITLSGILLSQMDKLVLSHLLQLSDFGVYVIAATLASSLSILIGPVFWVLYPRISAQWSSGDSAGMAGLYHSGSQVMALLVLPAAAVMACFPAASLFVLTADRVVSAQASQALVLLVVAAALNGLMNPPYALQLAAGWTSLSVWVNAAGIVVLAPLMVWAAGRYGIVGGAGAWALLNVAVLLLTPQLLHRRLLPAEKWRWYWHDVLLPAIAAGGAAALLASWVVVGQASRLYTALQLGLCWLAVAVATIAVLGRLRARVAMTLGR